MRRARRHINDWLISIPLHLDPVSGNALELAFRWKCLNELAFYTIFLDHLGLAEERDAVATAIDPLLDNVLADVALRSSERTLTFTFVLSRMLRHGTVDAARRRRIAECLGGPFAWGCELPAHRQLDMLVACAYADVAAPLSHSQVLSVSSVVLPPCPLSSSRDAFYALCHSLIFSRMLGGHALASESLLEVLDGAACRAYAGEDYDLGLEIVAAAIGALLPLTEAMRRIVVDVLDRLETVGLAQKDVSRFLAIKAYIEHDIERNKWAESFHLMLTAGMTLSMLQNQAVGLDASELPEDDVWRLGHAMLGFHRNAITAGLQDLRGYLPVTCLGRAHFRRMARFVRSLMQDDGNFGLFVEERAVFSSLNPCRDFQEDVEQPLTAACRDFLTQSAAT